MSIHNKLRITLVALFVFIVGLVGLNFATFAQLDGDAPAVNASGSHGLCRCSGGGGAPQYDDGADRDV